MLKTYLTAVAALVASFFGAQAQIVTTDPSPLQEDSGNVVIYYHADQGNKGLMGVGPSTEVYAHTGVCIVNAQGKTEDWKYAPSWNENLPKYRMDYVSENLWKLEMGDLRSYYGVAADETIKKLAFVFRTGDRSKEGKSAANGDIFVEISDGGFQLALTSSVDSRLVSASTGAVTFTASSTRMARVTVSVNGTTIAETANGKSAQGTYTFSAEGDYEVKATATSGNETIEKTLYYCNAPASAPASSAAVPPMGARRNADGSVTFCIAAPGKTTALLAGSWNGYRLTTSQSMQYVDGPANGEGSFRYFTTTLPASSAPASFNYYYVIDGIAVGDPYARLVLVPEEDKYISADVYPSLPAYPYDQVDGVPLAVFDDNFGAYEWKSGQFKGATSDNLVIYELLLRDFTGTEGKALGDGTVRKAIEKIPYLKRLGVNAVELLPVCEFNGNNSWGYNPNFYFAIDKAYGTPQDYKEFIDRCHQEGIAVILDVVLNQSDWLHPWYRLYPTGSNPFYNATAPHAYSVLNDWSQDYPLVQQQWKDMLKFWLEEYRVDGYRFDLVKGLGNNGSYANNSDAATNEYNASRVARMKSLHDAMREVNPDAYFINENLAFEKEENEMAADGELNWANYNNAGCQYAMGYEAESDLNGMWAPRSGRTAGSTVSYLESHDEQRLAYKQQTWGAEQVKTDPEVAARRLGSAAAQMLLTPGSHMIWQFSEMGNSQNTKNADEGNNTDPKIVDWSLLDNPVNNALVDSYRQLIGIRLGNPALLGPDAEYENNCSAWTVRTIRSRHGDDELIAVINPSLSQSVSVKMTFSVPDNTHYNILSASQGTSPVFNASTGSVTVPANSYVVIGSANVLAVDDIYEQASADCFSVTTGPGLLMIQNATEGTEVWSLSGVCSARVGSGHHTLELPGGVYIVRSGAKARKVIVK